MIQLLAFATPIFFLGGNSTCLEIGNHMLLIGLPKKVKHAYVGRPIDNDGYGLT